MKPKELTQERGTTHGSFEENARISQAIKDIYKSNQSWYDMDSVKQEALEMIALKISRILSGHSNFRDHFDDIAGYAHLAAESCEKDPE